MIDCASRIAGQCVSWSPVRVIMVTLLACGALLMLDRWRMEVSG